MDKISAMTIMHNKWLWNMGLNETASSFNEFGLFITYLTLYPVTGVTV